MDKYFLPLLCLLLLPLTVFAANEVSVTEDTNIYFVTSGINLVAKANSQVDSMEVGGSSVTFTMSPGSNITLVSAGKYTLSNTWGISTYCGSSSSVLTLTAPTSTSTVTVTPGAVCTVTSGGGGGGGGGGAIAVAPIIPATPVVPTTPIGQMTVSQLQTTIAQIQTQIATLMAQLSQLTGVTQGFATDLYYGMKGNADVKRLQEFLIGKGYLAAGLNTGNYLSLTLAAVKAYQTAKGITPVNGRCGPKTRTAINADLGL